MPTSALNSIATPNVTAYSGSTDESLLFTVGTPAGGWEPLARSLLDRSTVELLNTAFSAWLDDVVTPDTGSQTPVIRNGRTDAPSISMPGGALDERGVWVLDILAAKFPTARFLVFVEGPVRTLAHALASQPLVNPTLMLHRWCEAAQRILRHAQGHPTRCVLVEAGEMALAPEAAAVLLSRHLGLEFSASNATAVRQVNDPVHLALAAGLVRESRQAQTLFAELHASCTPLLAVDGTLLAVEKVDHIAAVHAYQELAQTKSELASRVETATAAEQRHAEQLGDAERRAAEASRDGERILLQLHQAQEELECASNELIQRTADLGALRGEADQLRERLRAVQTELDTSRAKTAELERASRAASERPTEVAPQHDASRQEADFLLAQLHAVQEELEHYYLALKQVEDTGPAARAPSVGFLRVETVEIGGEVATGPHQHLDFELQQVQTPHRSLPHLRSRLVEHHGRPGLVLFATDEDAQPLAAWRPSGNEAGRDFVALLPADQPARSLLEQMATGDWRLVVELVALLQQRLAASERAEAARWRTVAARLRKQLAQLPARLRYSHIEVQAVEPGAQSPELAVRFGDVVYGNEPCEDLLLRWRPNGLEVTQPVQSPVHWLAPTGVAAEPPLACWPATENGGLAASLAIPVGSTISNADKRRHWAAFSPVDRELTLALLDALPACAAQENLPAGVDRDALARSAVALHRDARRTLRQLQFRQGVRAALGRLRRG